MSVPETPCREWSGYRNPGGYGERRSPLDGNKWKVHRLEWTMKMGPIPQGMEVMHICDNPPCYEVTHLRLGTHAENMADMSTKGRAVGHPGEANGNTRHTATQIHEIRDRYAMGGTTHRKLAAEYGVTHKTIGNIINEKTWRTA